MSSLDLTVTPQSAANAYRAVDGAPDAATTDSGATDAGAFGGALRRAIEGAQSTGEQADSQAMQAIAGGGNLNEVVTAVSKAELALQTVTALRDRVVQAYQDIMRMPI